MLDQLAVGVRKSRGAAGAASALTGPAWYQQQALRWATSTPLLFTNIDQQCVALTVEP